MTTRGVEIRCPRCKGSGRVWHVMFAILCPDCNGRGSRRPKPSEGR